MSVVRIKSSAIERGVRFKPADRSVKETVDAFVDLTHDEKQELLELNSRMNLYVKQVKLLEDENKHLLCSIQCMRDHWCNNSRHIGKEFEHDLCDIRLRIDDEANAKTKADIQKQRANYESKEMQHQFDAANRLGASNAAKIKEYEHLICQLAESGQYLKDSIASETGDIEKHRKNRDETWAALGDLLDRLDDELFKRITVEYGNQTLREHIEFIKQINEHELNEMAQLGTVLPFNEQIDFYKDQLKRVISNIQKDYEKLHMDQTREMEEWMRMKKVELENMNLKHDPSQELELTMFLDSIASLRDAFEDNSKELCMLKNHEAKKLSALQDLEKCLNAEHARIQDTLEAKEMEVKKLNDDLAALTSDCNHVNMNKATLEYEINVYKRLLDSNSNSLQRTVKEAAVRKSEMKTKTTSQVVYTNETHGGQIKNSKGKSGPIEISNSLADGQFVQVHNASETDTIDLSCWILKRRVDDQDELVFRMPPQTILHPKESLKVWSRGCDTALDKKDLVSQFQSWGIGLAGSTQLTDIKNMEQSYFDHHILSLGQLDNKLLEFARDPVSIKRVKTADLIISWLQDFGVLSERPKSAAF